MNDRLNPKPVYYELEKLIKGEWWTNLDLSTGSQGNCRAKVFCGNYDIEVVADGRRVVVNRDILRAPDGMRVELSL